jgi:hypothetical protein
MFRKLGAHAFGLNAADADDWLDRMTHRRVPLFIRLLLSGFDPHQFGERAAIVTWRNGDRREPKVAC